MLFTVLLRCARVSEVQPVTWWLPQVLLQHKYTPEKELFCNASQLAVSSMVSEVRDVPTCCKLTSALQGVWLRDYEPVNQRQDNQSSVKETLGEIKPSNAYKRRVAGTNWQ